MIDDAVFDRRLGTDTCAAVPQSRLRVLTPEKQSDAKPYVMTRARALRHAFRMSPAPRYLRFNDIGCGKGKVVLVAALSGFKDVRGLDFAPELIDIAERNLVAMKDRLPKDAHVRVERADVTQAEYGPRDCVFFLYNPFCADVMRGFCEQLGRSLHEHPRRIWLIYADPAFLSVMLQYLPVQEKGRSKYGGYEFVYLEHCSNVASTAAQDVCEA
jgi:SAM-dependent methyltransferase